MSRILLLLTAHTYRAEPFLAAGERLGIEMVTAVHTPAPSLNRQGLPWR
ncbi:MAG: hypothetical protein M5U34_31590 [Chloroflexi bacterium]|nr:hypothetical protein [Chloroflexota bacterium]